MEYKEITKIIKKNLPILSQNEILHDLVHNGCRYVACKAPSLSTKLSPSMFSTNSESKTWLNHKGFYKCNSSRCNACKSAVHMTCFTSLDGNTSCKIKEHLDCNSHPVVYAIECIACNLMYIGCPIRKLKSRIAEHIADSSKPMSDSSGASKQFQTRHNYNTDSFAFYGKTACGGDWRKRLLKREAFWIYELNTRYPKGLNYRSDLFFLY